MKMTVNECPDSLEELQLAGMNFAKQKDIPRALDCFQRALLQDPTAVSLHTNLSNLYLTLGNIENALQHIRQGLRLHPQHAESYNNLGRVFYKQGNLIEAISNFEKALRLEPHYWEAHYNLAHSLASQNQMQRAASHYQEVIRYFPEHPIAHYNVGLIYFEEENFNLAKHHLTIARTLDDHNVTLLHFLAQTHLALGETSTAALLYEQTLHCCPASAEAHHNLAVLSLKQENKTKALAHFTNALALDPNNDTARHMIHSLNGLKTSNAAPPQYVAQLFDQYAEYYNHHVKTQLRYEAPFLLRNAIGHSLSNNPKACRILDLGCGTGLCGIVFRDLATDLVGIDLSSKMVEQAEHLQAYDKLLVIDLNDYLPTAQSDPFDLILAADVFVYSGDLSTIFKNVACALRPQGRFAFTTESLESGTYALQSTGRFAHSVTYIKTLATEQGFFIEREETIVLREHLGVPVAGHLYLLRYASST